MMVSKYWTIDQALIWLATGEQDSSKFWIEVGHRHPHKTAVADEMMRLLRSADDLLLVDGNSIPLWWFQDAELVPVPGDDAAAKLKVNFRSTIVQRANATPDSRWEREGNSWEHASVEGAAKWIDVAKFTEAATYVPPAVPVMQKGFIPIGRLIQWIAHGGRPLTHLRLSAACDEAEKDLFARLGQAPEQARARKIVDEHRESSIDGFLPGVAWDEMNGADEGDPVFFALDSFPPGKVSHDVDLEGGGTVHTRQRYGGDIWTSVRIKADWAMQQWPSLDQHRDNGQTDTPELLEPSTAAGAQIGVAQAVANVEEPKRRRRARKTYDIQDAGLIKKMHLEVEKNLLTPYAAAEIFASEAVGGGTELSKTRRLERRYRDTYPQPSQTVIAP